MKEITAQIKKNVEDMLAYKNTEAVPGIIKTVFETILKIERKAFLDEAKNEGEENATSPNKGNGFYSKLVRSVKGFFKIRVPRDRLGLFKPMLLESIQEQEEQLHTMALKLYSKGLSTRSIQEIFKSIYQKNLSHQTVSNMVRRFHKEIQAWQNKQLEEQYYFIFIDATYTPVRRIDHVSREAIFTAIGLRKDLKRDVLGVYKLPNESEVAWQEVIDDIKSRGVKHCLIFVADELEYLENVIARTFPGSKLQTCIFHKKKNLLGRVKREDKREVVSDLKELFVIDDRRYHLDEAIDRMTSFINKWSKKYPSFKNQLRNEKAHKYFAYLNFPYQIQRMIYTTNWVERLHKEIKKTLKVRNSMPTPASALFLVSAFLIDYELGTYSFPVNSFKNSQGFLDDKLMELQSAA